MYRMNLSITPQAGKPGITANTIAAYLKVRASDVRRLAENLFPDLSCSSTGDYWLTKEQCLALQPYMDNQEVSQEYKAGILEVFEEAMFSFKNIVPSYQESILTREIAAELKMSAVKLNKILADKGVQRRLLGKWVLNEFYHDKGLATGRDYVIAMKGGYETNNHLVWTPKGKDFILNLISPHA